MATEAEAAASVSSTVITSAVAPDSSFPNSAMEAETQPPASLSSTEITSAVAPNSSFRNSAMAAEAEPPASLSSTEITSAIAPNSSFPNSAMPAEAEAPASLSSTVITSAVAPNPSFPNSVMAAEVEAPASLSSTVITSAVDPNSSFPNSAMAAEAEAPASLASAVATTKPRLRGVVFDMDGTLTVPVIDFQAMHRAVLGEDEYLAVKSKSPTGIDILRHVENWSPEKQQKAHEIIVDYERQGLDRLRLCLVLQNFVVFLTQGTSGLITRNIKESVDFFHQQFGMEFSPALSREFRPYKPDPAPLLHICKTWQIPPNEVMMIGDSLKDDVGVGKRAGAYTCLLDQTGKYDAPEYANVEYKPDYKVSSLAEICSLLEADFNLTPCPCCDPQNII